MIKSLTVTNDLGESIKLELMRPELSGFLVQSVDGLGPVKANINTTKMAVSDGSIYNSASLDQRSIVLNLIFLDSTDESIEDLRHKSYRYFPLKKQIRFCVETDNRTSEVTGYVESNDPNIFNNQEGCSIAIVCTDPLFYTLHPSNTIFSGSEPVFEFPFSNESTSDPLLEMGTVKTNTEENVYYEGDSEVGVTIKIHSVGEASNVAIYNLNSREKMTIDTSKMIIEERTNIFDDEDVTWESDRIIALSGKVQSFSETFAGSIPEYKSDTMVSGYIPVISGTILKYRIATPRIIAAGVSKTTVLCGYDAQKAYVYGSNIDIQDKPEAGSIISGEYEIPSDVKYIRVEIDDKYIDEYSFVYVKPQYKEVELFNETDVTWESGMLLNADGTTKQYTADNRYKVSDFILVNPGTLLEYCLRVPTDKHVVIVEYDSYKSFLGNEISTNDSASKILLSNETRYIRVCTWDVGSLVYLKSIESRIKKGDTITINTERGNKSIHLQRNGETFNIFNCLGKKSDWLTLSRGDNLFAYRAETGGENLQFRIENKTAYTGV